MRSILPPKHINERFGQVLWILQNVVDNQSSAILVQPVSLRKPLSRARRDAPPISAAMGRKLRRLDDQDVAVPVSDGMAA